jgi:hypothetical protein
MHGKDAPALGLAVKHDRCVIAGDGRSSGRLWLETDTCHPIAHANTGEHYSHPSSPYADAQGKRPAACSSHEHCHDRSSCQYSHHYSHARTRRTLDGAGTESW